jgi:hypothetical protein
MKEEIKCRAFPRTRRGKKSFAPTSPGSVLRRATLRSVRAAMRHFVPVSSRTNRFTPFSGYPLSPLTQNPKPKTNEKED